MASSSITQLRWNDSIKAVLMIHVEQAGKLKFSHMDQLAELIADFHAECPSVSGDKPFGEPGESLFAGGRKLPSSAARRSARQTP